MELINNQDEVKQFLRTLSGTCRLELNNLDRKVTFDEAWGGENIYFLGGIKPGLTSRASDKDIEKKCYLCVDIDIRMIYYKKTGLVMTDDEMLLEMFSIITAINEGGLGDYSYMTHSGNGIHLYYVGTERYIEPRTYSDGVSYIYDTINATLLNSKQHYTADPACKNISRIMRMPGSINPRRKLQKGELLYDCGPAECILSYSNPVISTLFDSIEEFAKLFSIEREQEREDAHIVKKAVRDYRPDDVWADINAIPAYLIAQDIWGVTMSDKGLDNVSLKEPHKNMGAYRRKPTNVIVNTGSSLIRTQKNFFTTYDLVLYEMFNGSKQRTMAYFKDRYGIDISRRKRQEIGDDIALPPKQYYTLKGFVYPHKIFNDAFSCLMSGELCIVVAQSNSGKSTWSMDMIQENAIRGKKCYYINLEFAIETVWKSRWLFMNGKQKHNLTDIAPLTAPEQENLKNYVDMKLKQFDYYNDPRGISLGALVDLIVEKSSEGYELFVVDTLSRIDGNMDSNKAHTTQNKTMSVLQELCQNTGVTIILLHHTNKTGEFEGSQKIMDLANVFIKMEKATDTYGANCTKYTLSKDKYQSFVELGVIYNNGEHILTEL